MNDIYIPLYLSNIHQEENLAPHNMLYSYNSITKKHVNNICVLLFEIPASKP